MAYSKKYSLLDRNTKCTHLCLKQTLHGLLRRWLLATVACNCHTEKCFQILQLRKKICDLFRQGEPERLFHTLWGPIQPYKIKNNNPFISEIFIISEKSSHNPPIFGENHSLRTIHSSTSLGLLY